MSAMGRMGLLCLLQAQLEVFNLIPFSLTWHAASQRAPS